MIKAIAILVLTLILSGFAETSAPKAAGHENGAAAAQTADAQGCLSANHGVYTLTDEGSGLLYDLSGDARKLQIQVGHQIQVTGAITAAAPGSSETTLAVRELKRIADHCASQASGGSLDSDSDITDPKTQAQASQALPLVGLLGLGSLVAGFLVRR